MKVRHYLTGLIVVIVVAAVGAAFFVPKGSDYVKWASMKYPKEALSIKVDDTTVKSYGVLDTFETITNTDTIQAIGVFGHLILVSHIFH